jgi:LmbE family N-acetylglucosaminyl deacetylase
LDDLVRLRNDIDPDLVFIPSTSDIHQDHAVLTSEAIRAFRRKCSVYGYDFPWNVLQTSSLQLFVELTEPHLVRKVRACQCFNSQIQKENNCFSEEYIRGLAIERGNRIGCRYAEAFEVLRDVRRVGHGTLD